MSRLRVITDLFISVVSTVDTGLGPKKNPFSVFELNADGEEQWTLQHIRNKEMGYQYIGESIRVVDVAF